MKVGDQHEALQSDHLVDVEVGVQESLADELAVAVLPNEDLRQGGDNLPNVKAVWRNTVKTPTLQPYRSRACRFINRTATVTVTEPYRHRNVPQQYLTVTVTESYRHRNVPQQYRKATVTVIEPYIRRAVP